MSKKVDNFFSNPLKKLNAQIEGAGFITQPKGHLLDGVIAPVPRSEWDLEVAKHGETLMSEHYQTKELKLYLEIVELIGSKIDGRTSQSKVDMHIKFLEAIAYVAQDAQNKALEEDMAEQEEEYKEWQRN